MSELGPVEPPDDPRPEPPEAGWALDFTGICKDQPWVRPTYFLPERTSPVIRFPAHEARDSALAALQQAGALPPSGAPPSPEPTLSDTRPDVEGLRRLARETGLLGEWHIGEYYKGTCEILADGVGASNLFIAHYQTNGEGKEEEPSAEAHFVVAATPGVVLALCDYILALEARHQEEVGRLNELLAEKDQQYVSHRTIDAKHMKIAEAERDDLRETLREVIDDACRDGCRGTGIKRGGNDSGAPCTWEPCIRARAILPTETP